MSGQEQRWNHNIHYYPLVLAAVPAGCRRALDVGCGEGSLARLLAGCVPEVVGIDEDAPSLALAREQGSEGRVEYVPGDFLAHPFAPASGVRYRRHLLWRYSLTWAKPAAPGER